MGFGLNFHRHQVPEWAAEYFDYSNLKARIKEGQSSHPGAKPKKQVSYCYARLKADVDLFRRTYHSKYGVAKKMEAELCSQYRLQSPVEEHQALVEQRSKADLWDFFDRLSSLQAYLAKLHWFVTVNSEAISRIYKGISDIDVLECSGAPLIEVPAACIAECETEIKRTCRLKIFLTSYLESNGLERIGRDGQGHLSLHYGATLGDYEICLSALKRSIDANGTSDDINNALLRCDERKWTPLHIGVIYNHCAILELFLNALKLRGV
ncbi:hypothetical protein LOZ58_004948 [Ophidiomyces ophidiicola]|nr:hypothetical protein LOZ65_002751 [Ophidiomyces ophidiicola]KAI1936004.1 hypothetical protein LOZ66_004922 [Ophidiomyces ophidiicola]KAI1958911.1 hypothetical protein LOZ58_004948 [Ophidiomyces ophidiicola]